jgi:hypothetical protein
MSDPEPITWDYATEQIIRYRIAHMFRHPEEWPEDSIFAQMEAAKDLPPAVLTREDLLRFMEEL